MVATGKTLLDFLPSWYDQLQHWSLGGQLSAAAQEALLLDGEPQALKDLVSQWSAGNFQAVPEIVLLSNADINGALGAYAQSTGKIYLNADWLTTATQEAVNAVLTEELGHHLDALLNAVDTSGDEGRHFSSILHGSSGGVSYYLMDATGQIQENGNILSAEFSLPENSTTLANGHLYFTNRISTGTSGYIGFNTIDLNSSDVSICNTSGTVVKSFKIYKSFGDGVVSFDNTKVLCSFRSTTGTWEPGTHLIDLASGQVQQLNYYNPDRVRK